MMTTSQAMLFSVHRESEPDCVRMRLVGELDYASVRLFQAELDHTDALPVSSIILDVSELCFLDLAGMRAIMSVFDREPWRNASLVGATGSVRRLIELVAKLRPPPDSGERDLAACVSQA
jgi:anti-anti-sigma regulatory factor